MQKLLLVIIVFLLAFSICWASDPSEKPETAKPRFLDLNGDGLNDLSPDHDRDGIPDQIDPDFLRQNPDGSMPDDMSRMSLWKCFRSIPDSISQDSASFKDWWNDSGNQMNWQRAWHQWQFIQEHEDRRRRAQWLEDHGINPRNGRLIGSPSPRDRKERDRRRREENEEERRRRGVPR